MKLTNVQNRSINDILGHYYNGERKLQLKAPTGSGKTFIIANLISQMLVNNNSKKVVFIIATISNADLHKQFANKLDEYQPFLKSGISFQTTLKESPSKNSMKVKDFEIDLTVNENDVLVLGKASFSKSSLFRVRGTFDRLIDQIRNEDFHLVYIRDEAHYGTKKLSLSKSEMDFESQLNNAASFIINMTATPKDEDQEGRLVTITEEELEDDEGKRLLKSDVKINIGIENDTDGYDDIKLLNVAIKQYKKIKNLYNNDEKLREAKVNPAMLIQIDNEPVSKYDKELFNRSLTDIKNTLMNSGINCVLYTGNEKWASNKGHGEISLSDISKTNSDVEAIIFKVGPATGWDIPRACMLVQLRNISSKTLNTQTIGRIKRNPLSSLEENDVAKKYYLYSNYNDKKGSQFATYILKKEKINEKFASGKVERIIPLNDDEPSVNIQRIYSRYINKAMKDNFLLSEIKSVLYVFKVGDPIPVDEEILYEVKEKNSDSLKKSSTGQSVFYYKRRLVDLLDLRIYLQNEFEDSKQYSAFIPLLGKKIKELVDRFSSLNADYDKILFSLIRANGGKLWREIYKEYKRLLKKHYEEIYEIFDNKRLPDNYRIWKSSEERKSMVDFDSLKNIYGYYRIDAKDKKYIQYLDGGAKGPEVRFGDYFKWIFDRKMSSRSKFKWDESEISFFAKNPAMRGVSFQYYHHDDDEIKTTFPDFIVKVFNYYIYIEIKGSDKNDYDEDKTLFIEKAYEKYPTESEKGNVIMGTIKFPAHGYGLQRNIFGDNVSRLGRHSFWGKDGLFEVEDSFDISQNMRLDQVIDYLYNISKNH